ncbi:hypothetical protein N9057_06165 [Akkermansiaceae bacterium]|nr:hypothetical protein [Akkermansiaceae bacterium]
MSHDRLAILTLRHHPKLRAIFSKSTFGLGEIGLLVISKTSHL